MRLLLDTHAFLWAAGGDPRLSDAAREAIETADQPPSVSAASFWEIAIKIEAGKLQADVDGGWSTTRPIWSYPTPPCTP